MNEIVGSADCHVCSEKVDIKLTKKDKSYYSCGECGLQVFARGAVADKKLRVLAIVAPVTRSQPVVENIPPKGEEKATGADVTETPEETEKACSFWDACE